MGWPGLGCDGLGWAVFLNNCMFFMRTIDFVEAGPSFLQKTQILLGRTQKIHLAAAKRKVSKTHAFVSIASKPLLSIFVFFVLQKNTGVHLFRFLFFGFAPRFKPLGAGVESQAKGSQNQWFLVDCFQTIAFHCFFCLFGLTLPKPVRSLDLLFFFVVLDLDSNFPTLGSGQEKLKFHFT